MALTGKKKAFAGAIIAGKSNKQAAIEAGYSESTASAAGSRLVKDKDVIKLVSKGSEVPKPEIEPNEDDMLKFLQDIALGRMDATAIQVRAAIAAVQYTHTKRADGGKKDVVKDAAAEVSSLFGLRTPRLKAVK